MGEERRGDSNGLLCKFAKWVGAKSSFYALSVSSSVSLSGPPAFFIYICMYVCIKEFSNAYAYNVNMASCTTQEARELQKPI